MRVITAFILAAARRRGRCRGRRADHGATGMYTTLQSREQTTRRALDAGKPERVVRRDVQRIVVGYEGLVARFPRNGYADNALWQAAFLAADSFARYRVDVDRQTSVRLLRRLAKEYPASPLIKRAEPALKRLVAAAPAASARLRPAVASVSAPAPALRRQRQRRPPWSRSARRRDARGRQRRRRCPARPASRGFRPSAGPCFPTSCASPSSSIRRSNTATSASRGPCVCSSISSATEVGAERAADHAV